MATEVLTWYFRHRICFSRVLRFHVEGYMDSDYDSDLDARKSMIGYVFTLTGGPMS